MISDQIRNQLISITNIKEISIFLTEILRHITEIVKNIIFIISEICMLIIVQARLISSSDIKNMYNKNSFLVKSEDEILIIFDFYSNF